MIQKSEKAWPLREVAFGYFRAATIMFSTIFSAATIPLFLYLISLWG